MRVIDSILTSFFLELLIQMKYRKSKNLSKQGFLLELAYVLPVSMRTHVACDVSMKGVDMFPSQVV